MRTVVHQFIVAASAMALVACGGGGKDQAANATQAEDSTPAPAAPSASAAPVPIPGGPMSKEDMAKAVCIFTPEEVTTAMGFAVEAGKPELEYASSGMAGCVYKGKDNDLRVNMIWTDPVYYAQTRANPTMMRAGKLEKLPGDADVAFMQYQDAGIGGALHYLRRNIMVEVRPMSWMDSSNEAMKAKLLKLPRRP
jgi:hypothetical protein